MPRVKAPATVRPCIHIGRDGDTDADVLERHMNHVKGLHVLPEMGCGICQAQAERIGYAVMIEQVRRRNAGEE